MSTHFENGDIAIEFGTSGNDNVYFDPVSDILRGRHERSNLLNRQPGASSRSTPLLSIDVIPGMVAVLNVRKKRAAVIDPLEWPENKALLDSLQSKIESMPGQTVVGRKIGPVPAMRRDAMTDSDVATWWYHMKRLTFPPAAGGGEVQARLVFGEFGVCPPGKIIADAAASRHSIRTLEQFVQFNLTPLEAVESFLGRPLEIKSDKASAGSK